MPAITEKASLSTWWLVGAAWIAMVVLVGGIDPFLGNGWPTIAGDDAWRLVEVQDLVNGQAWSDTTQYRDNAPYGAPMHWSRLVDAPIAALIWVFRPTYGSDAILAAASLWPLLLTLPFLALVAALAERLAGPGARLPALLVAVMAPLMYSEFAPGRADHHNVQMVLILGLMLATVMGRTGVGAACVAGVIAATCIAIGTECLPAVLAAGALFPLFWIMDPTQGRGPVIGFASGLVLGLCGHLLLASGATSGWSEVACDALSIAYVGAGLAYAVAVAGVVAIGANMHPPVRFGMMAIGGALAIAATLVMFPDCLKGPYGALDPDLAKILLTDISEAQPLWRWVPDALGGAVGLLGLPLAGLVGAVAAALLSRGERRLDWLTIAAFSVMLVIVTIAQVRGLRLAMLPALPVGGWAIAQALIAMRARPGLLKGMGVVATFAVFSGVLHVVSTFLIAADAQPSDRQAALSESYDACIQPASYERLAGLPTGEVMSYLLMGTNILFSTPHSIVSAGYHRGEEGLRDALAFVSSDEATALSIARERSLDYFVFCKGVPLNSGLHDLPDFQGITEAGVQWDWLNPLTSPEEPVQIYSIQPEK